LDYDPFGMMMVGRSWQAGSEYRYGFNSMEKDDELKGNGNSYDFGARIYDPRLGRFLSMDPEMRLYAGLSPYHFVRNNPILRIDPTGKWDITVHAYSNRSNYGYGIAIVKDRSGKEIQRFKVRLEGTGGTDRLQTNANTPLGTYDIPSTSAWLSGGSRASYGPNDRLNLTPESGEIVVSGRDLIRIHGGRQETYNAATGEWVANENPVLKKTHGCLRCFDADIDALKTNTDNLETNDVLESPGKLNIVDDLIEKDGNYYTPDDYNSFNNAETELKDSQEQDKGYGSGVSSYGTSKKASAVSTAKEKGIN